MPYSLEFNKERDHIRVTVRGEFEKGNNIEEIQGLWSEIAGFCNKGKHFKILVIYKMDRLLTVMEAYDLARKARKILKWNTEFRTAAVVSSLKTVQKMLFDFTENVAFNYGYRVKIFDDEEKAIEWLYNE